MQSPPLKGIGWNFIHQNPNDSSFYNNAAVYATPESIKSLVRETTQNSLDAKKGGREVTVRYTLIELDRGSRKYAEVLDAIGYRNYLKPHIEAAAREAGADSDGGVRLVQGLESVEAKAAPLRLLLVEDFGAAGLAGDEHGKDSPFSALVRDQGHSNKEDQRSGGSHGVGSKTLFGSSQIMTVFFASLVHGHETKGARLVGKSDLSVHTLGGQTFAGRGWWGRAVPPDGANSVWPATNGILSQLFLERTPPVGEKARTGSSMLIFAFSEVEADDMSGEEVVERIKKELAESFWPSMMRKDLRGEVRLIRNDEQKPVLIQNVEPEKYVPSFVDAFRKHEKNDTEEILEKPGDTVSVPVELRIPATTEKGKVSPQHQEITAECRLVIRLAEDDSVDRHLVDRVGYTRGRGMITQYTPKRNIAAGARTFHAVLLAGTIVDSSKESDAAEHFLRFAEPAAHNEWSTRKGLRFRYGPSAGPRIDAMQNAILEQLRKYVCAKATESDKGPDSLKEIFRLGTSDATRRKEPAARVASAAVPFVNGRFRLTATIDLNHIEEECLLRPRLFVASAAEGAGIRCDWDDDLQAAGLYIVDNVIRVPKGRKRVLLTGSARVRQKGLDPSLCAVSLELEFVKV